MLQARAEARAILYHAFEFDLEEALAPLLDYALKAGIVDDIGAAAAIAIIHTPFGIGPPETTTGDDDGGS